MDQSISSREASYKMAAIALQAPTLFVIPTKVRRGLYDAIIPLVSLPA